MARNGLYTKRRRDFIETYSELHGPRKHNTVQKIASSVNHATDVRHTPKKLYAYHMSMLQPLVSIISPCYNVASYIERFLDSLCIQTYKNLEIILVNYGLTDNTGNIIGSYIPLLEQQGYKTTYLEQANGGQSSAINNALKLVRGKFLTWPDPDDWLTPDSIEKRVRFLLDNPDVGLVRGTVVRIDSDTETQLGTFASTEGSPYELENLFLDLTFARTWFAPVGYMVNMIFFDRVVAQRNIYVHAKGGQNWQMMLPILSAYPAWQLPDVVCFYLVRSNSHSHEALKSLLSKLSYQIVNEEVLTSTLSKIRDSHDIITRVNTHFKQMRASLISEELNRISSEYDSKLLEIKNSLQENQVNLALIMSLGMHSIPDSFKIMFGKKESTTKTNINTSSIFFTNARIYTPP